MKSFKRARKNPSLIFFPLILAAPTIIITILVTGWPLIQTIWYSFHFFQLTKPEAGTPFVALAQYQKMFKDPLFGKTLFNTIYWTAGSVVGQFIIGFILALILNERIKYRNFFRGILLTPWVIPSIVAAFLWYWIFNPEFGILNVILKDLGVITTFKSWLMDPKIAMPSLILANVWKGFPFAMLMLLAGLQTIPPDLIEAAKVDGANTLNRFRHITLPLLKPIIILVTILSFIWESQNFTLIWVTTQGGPMFSTETFVIRIYKLAFQAYDFGYAAAYGTLWLIILLILTIFYLRLVMGGERR
ncbi:sugar ABC transporter permease [Candidatus Bathyarchaeota archaeon]|nr:sugar ABC transporter permease [Candidatus Bathyarchaeota archaeon]